ncbi:MAG TPA: ABC transporter permease [Casimicrobiaceae bacterium]|nr:ABC transporter permease [Casimicrobiaceae bacterium]
MARSTVIAGSSTAALDDVAPRVGRPQRARRTTSPSRRWYIGSIALAATIALWFVATAAGWVTGGRFPTPSDVWRAAMQISTDGGYGGGTLLQHIWQSCRLVLLGFAVAVATGVPLGLLMGSSRRADALVSPVFMLLRPIPPLAWIPLAILWLGLGDAAKIFVIWVAAFVPSVINTFTGVRSVDVTLQEAARVHGASRAVLLRDVMIPGALPMIFTGLRLSLQASWTTLVAAELVGAFTGLGKVLSVATLDIYPGMILFAMVWVGVLGALMTKSLAWLETRLLPWLR